ARVVLGRKASPPRQGRPTTAPSLLVSHRVGCLEAAHCLPRPFASLIRVPNSGGLVANTVECRECARAPRIHASDVPTILRLNDRPRSKRQPKEGIAETFAEGCRQTRDRTPEDSARLLLQILGLALCLDVFELPPRRHLVGRRRQVESNSLRLVEPL